MFKHVIDYRSSIAAEHRDTKRNERRGQWEAAIYKEASDLMARFPARADKIAADTEEIIAKGPDWLRYRRGSDFAPPPKVSTDRNHLARIMFAVEMIEDKSSGQRSKGCHHGGKLGRPVVALIRAMLFKANKRKGFLAVSYDRLAMLAHYSRRAVVTAMAKLVEYGFVTIHRRLKFATTPLGGRKVVQAENAYTYQMPRSGLGAWWVAIYSGSSECTGSTEAFRQKENKKAGEDKRAESAADRLHDLGLFGLRSM